MMDALAFDAIKFVRTALRLRSIIFYFSIIAAIWMTLTQSVSAAGTVAPSAPSTSTPIVTGTYTGNVGGVFAGPMASIGLVCENIRAQLGYLYPSYTASVSACGVGLSAISMSLSNLSGVTVYVGSGIQNPDVLSCPSGYTLSNFSCVLTEPSVFCPAHASGSPCTCNTDYQPDPTATGCVPADTCPVSDLSDPKDIPPNGPDVLPLTQRLENTKGSDLALLPAAEEGIACLKRKTAGVFVSSGTRTVAYQAHLKEIWDKLRELNKPSNLKIKACKPLRDKVLAEKEGCSNNSGHCIRFQPSADSKHTIGKAFDVHMVTIDTLLLNLRPIPPLPPKLPLNSEQQKQADVKLIAEFLAKPAACRLVWGGSYDDFVHFAVP